MKAEFHEDQIEDIYTNFEEELEDGGCSGAEAAFMRGYMGIEEEEDNFF